MTSQPEQSKPKPKPKPNMVHFQHQITLSQNDSPWSTMILFFHHVFFFHCCLVAGFMLEPNIQVVFGTGHTTQLSHCHCLLLPTHSFHICTALFFSFASLFFHFSFPSLTALFFLVLHSLSCCWCLLLHSALPISQLFLRAALRDKWPFPRHFPAFLPFGQTTFCISQLFVSSTLSFASRCPVSAMADIGAHESVCFVTTEKCWCARSVKWI